MTVQQSREGRLFDMGGGGLASCLFEMVPKWDDDENIHYFLQRQKNGTNLFKFPIPYSQDLKIDGVKHYMWRLL